MGEKLLENIQIFVFIYNPFLQQYRNVIPRYKLLFFCNKNEERVSNINQSVNFILYKC